MDVHPPHQPVHSWRDALMHIGIMTIGLFIALSLEGLIERFHHRELVTEARENIRVELQQNHDNVPKNLADLETGAKNIQNALDTLADMRTHPEKHGSIQFHWNFINLSDTAFHTARDTGAFGYMPYQEVEHYTSLYKLQDTISTGMDAEESREVALLAPIAAQAGDDPFKTMPEEQYQTMRKDAATLMLNLEILRQYLVNLDKDYVDQLKSRT